jgi:hypothetical protein
VPNLKRSYNISKPTLLHKRWALGIIKRSDQGNWVIRGINCLDRQFDNKAVSIIFTIKFTYLIPSLAKEQENFTKTLLYTLGFEEEK